MERGSAPAAVIGSRLGAPTLMRRVVARATAGTLAAFVVPDARTARTMGLDLPSVGLEIVASPRHASVLVLIGQLPHGLAGAAAVAYAQMPRPRAVLVLGGDVAAPLSGADATTTLNQAGLVEGISRIRDQITHRSWSSTPVPFTAPILERAADGAEGDMDHSDHAEMDHGKTQHRNHAGMSHGAMEHGDAAGIDHGGHASMDHAGMTHGGMDHGMMGHDHHMMDGGFMSMIAMTRDLPRSRDGLPMEWLQTSFGPLFPSLPGGLAPSLTLDGDTVVTATLTTGVMHRGIAASLPGPVATFPDRLSTLDPWAPVAYRLLAERALEAIDGSAIHNAVDRGWIGALERERAINHLGWLAAFGEVLGAAWLAKRAAEVQLGLVHASDIVAVSQLRSAIDRVLRDAGRIPLLSRRLAGIGVIDPATAATTRGPVARGAGVAADARVGDPVYHALGFIPVLRHDGDALARLQVRLADIGRSLELVAAAGSLRMPPPTVSPHLSGTGMATIETPRGAASLHIEVDHGYVHMTHVQTPSAAHVSLLSGVTEGAELADALVAIASLDLSPWEIDQ